jgi:hypothetical protein
MQKYIQRLTTGDRNALCPGKPYQQNVKFLSMIEYDFSNVLQGRYYLDADFNIGCAELVANGVAVEQVFYDPETQKKSGRARKFDPEGNLIYSGEFAHDKPVGMVWQITDGQRHEQFFTTAGKLQGRQTSTDAEGNVDSTFYRQGKKINGLSFWLDENIMDIIQGFNSRIFEPVGGFILRRKKGTSP